MGSDDEVIAQGAVDRGEQLLEPARRLAVERARPQRAGRMVVREDQSSRAQIDDPGGERAKGDLDIGPRSAGNVFGGDEMSGAVEKHPEQAFLVALAESPLEIFEKGRAGGIDDPALQGAQRAVVGELARRGDRFGQLPVRGQGCAERFARGGQGPGGRPIGCNQAACYCQRIGAGEGAKPRRQLGYGPQAFSRRIWAASPPARKAMAR